MPMMLDVQCGHLHLVCGFVACNVLTRADWCWTLVGADQLCGFCFRRCRQIYGDWPVWLTAFPSIVGLISNHWRAWLLMLPVSKQHQSYLAPLLFRTRLIQKKWLKILTIMCHKEHHLSFLTSEKSFQTLTATYITALLLFYLVLPKGCIESFCLQGQCSLPSRAKSSVVGGWVLTCNVAFTPTWQRTAMNAHGAKQKEGWYESWLASFPHWAWILSRSHVNKQTIAQKAGKNAWWRWYIQLHSTIASYIVLVVFIPSFKMVIALHSSKQKNIFAFLQWHLLHLWLVLLI